MASMSQADRLPSPADFDYTKSHRTVPVPTIAYATTPAGSPPKFHDQPGRPRDDTSSVHTEGRRRGSFSSFLRRSSSHQKDSNAPPLPPAPSTRIAQAYAQAAVATENGSIDRHNPANAAQNSSGNSNNKHYRAFSSTSSRKSSGDGAKMLRKSSKMRQQQEQDRLAREAAAAYQVPKQAPHLPSLNPLPNIGTFGGEDARPDSVAIFTNQYTTTNNSSHVPRQQGATAANFSRPGNAAMPPSSSYNNSSSPVYALRPGNGNAFAQAAASSPATGGRSTNGEHVADPPHRAGESMTNRGRYSYASSTAPHVNSPRRVRRRKDPTPFNVLVIGAKNSGKTSFISFLRHSLALSSDKQSYTNDPQPDPQGSASRTSFTSHYLESEMDGERMGVTLWDSAGLEKHIIDLQLREMAAFVESKFEETFLEEQKVMRSPGVKDTHIHCVFLVLDPVRLDTTVAASAGFQKGGVGLANAGGLDDELDLQVMRGLWGKTTVIPVISKADTLTTGHMGFLKRAVWDSLKGAKLDPMEALELEGEEEEEEDDEDAIEEGDEEEADGRVIDTIDSGSDSENADTTPLPKSKKTAHARQASLAATVTSANGDEPPYIPMSILSPDPYDLPPYTKALKTDRVGRRFPWGFADPYDPEHCDFTRLRDSIFSEWRADLRDLARTKWYENWRTSRLKNLPGSGKQRMKGGVTPVAAVPREGRMSGSPRSNRNASAVTATATATVGGAQAAVPRSVSGSTAATGMAFNNNAVPLNSSAGAGAGGKAERMMGMGASDTQSVASASRGGTYRGVESYQ